MRLFYTLAFAFVGSFLIAQNSLPLISNLRVEEDEDAGFIELRYDLSDAENDLCTIEVYYSPPGRNTHSVKLEDVTGAVGPNIGSGTDKVIVWTYQAPLAGGSHGFKIVASDGSTWNTQAVLDEIDNTALESNLQFVVGPRHRTSNPTHLAMVQDSLENLFEQYQWNLEVQEWNYGSYRAKNYIGTLPGTTSDTVSIMLGGHYDSVAGSPGADDNGTATSALMEAIRVLSQFRFHKTIRLVGFDLEEEGLVGSSRYVSQIFPQDETLEGFLDWEMIGYYREDPNSQSVPFGFSILFPGAYQALEMDSFKGNFITNVGNDNSAGLLQAFENAAANYVPDLRVISVQVPGNGTSVPDLLRSDHAPFWITGEKALMLTDGANFRNPNYHQGTDVIDSVNFTFMSQVFHASIATAVELAQPHHAGQASVTLEKTVGIKETAEALFNLRPNPVKNRLWVELTSPVKKISIVDAKGKFLYQEEGRFANDIMIDASNWPEGLYLLHVSDGNRIWVEKFFKLK